MQVWGTIVNEALTLLNVAWIRHVGCLLCNLLPSASCLHAPRCEMRTVPVVGKGGTLGTGKCVVNGAYGREADCPVPLSLSLALNLGKGCRSKTFTR